MTDGSTREKADRLPAAPSVDLQKLLEIIELCYQAIESPERLGRVLGRVAQAVGVSSALLVATDGGERRLLADGHAALTPGAAQVPPARPSRRDQGTRTVPLGGGLELVLDRAELGPDQQHLLTRLLPHLTRAFRLADRLATIERRTLHAAALDRLQTGVAILARRGRVLFLNRAARGLIEAGVPITLEEGRLTPLQPMSRARFESLVESVSSSVPSPGRRSGGRVRLEWDTAGVELLVVAFDGCLDGEEASSVVFLSRPGAVPGIEARLAETYELTETELRVALQLVEGCPASEATDDEAGSILSAIGTLYEKLGSTRQRDLVWLLLRPPGAVLGLPRTTRLGS